MNLTKEELEQLKKDVIALNTPDKLCRNCKHYVQIGAGKMKLCEHPKLNMQRYCQIVHQEGVTDMAFGPDFGCVHFNT